MATNTYVALDKKTITSPVAYVDFTSISSAYTDLVLVVQGTMAAGSGAWIGLQFNGDTASNYSETRIYGNGSAAGSIKRTNQTIGFVGALYSGIGQFVCNIQNYASTTTCKTIVSRNSSPTSGEASAFVTLWRKTPEAINAIRVIAETDTIAIGTTFSLYGIKAWTDETSTKATGGYVYSDSSYFYHVFPYSGTFTPNQSITADYLVIAGGGGGGYDTGGGGGAGGLRSTVGTTGGGGSLESALSLTAQAYTVTVGSGGAGALTGSRHGSNGSDSTISTVTSTGGGGGGDASSAGNSGGSGGGTRNSGSGGSGTAGQGYAGGSANHTSAGSGGGGAGQAGQGTVTTNVGGVGGNGVQILAFANATATGVGGYYAGGGGGGSNYPSPKVGGLGGGGQGGSPAGFNITSGVVNTGSGGGGCGGGDSTGFGNGGSGLVIVRYAK